MHIRTNLPRDKLRNVINTRFMGTATALLEREFHHSLVDQVKEDFKGADPDTFSKKNSMN